MNLTHWAHDVDATCQRRNNVVCPVGCNIGCGLPVAGAIQRPAAEVVHGVACQIQSPPEGFKITTQSPPDNNVDTTMANSSTRVPQRSVISIQLFSFYVHDICNVSKLIKCILFADDTNLFFSGKCIKHM